MKKILNYILCILAFYHWHATYASDEGLPDTVLIPFENDIITIDGNLEDWGNFFHTIFKDTANQIYTVGNYSLEDVYPDGFKAENILQPKSKNTVDVQLCWNNEALFLGMIVTDSHLVAELSGKEDNPNIYLNDAIELYIDTKNDSKERMDINDYQFIIDVLNQHVVFRGDLGLQNEDTLFVPKERGQNIILESKVSSKGEVNDNNIDEFFIVEVKIPFAAIGIVPKEGKLIKIDICNDDADWFLQEMNIAKKDLFLTWPFNWSGIGDFGFPNNWKNAKLVGHQSIYNEVSEKYQYQWIEFLGIFLFAATLIGIILYIRIKRLKRMPTPEIVQKQIIIKPEGSKNETEPFNRVMLNNASNFILENISSKLTPIAIAEFLNISVRTLQRLTREELDCTPTTFINTVKLQFAKKFLENKKGNISEAAYESGFSDPAYFSKLFKKHYGISPKSFLSKDD